MAQNPSFLFIRNHNTQPIYALLRQALAELGDLQLTSLPEVRLDLRSAASHATISAQLNGCDLVFLDAHCERPPATAVAELASVLEAAPYRLLVVTTEEDDWHEVRDALLSGAMDYMRLRGSLRDIKEYVTEKLELSRTLRNTQQPRRQKQPTGNLR